MSFLLGFIGHNGIRPCRMCNIRGITAPGGQTNYIPLDRSRHPAILNDSSLVHRYDPRNLPMRTHEEIRAQAEKVDLAPNITQAKKLSSEYGVKGLSIFFNLSSVKFPYCAPYEIMHLFFENILRLLISLWTASFKDLDVGSGDYELDMSVWEAIGAATAACGGSIPSAFGQRPVDISSKAGKQASMADSWSFWLMYLAPVLLHNKFKQRDYYNHFVEFAKIIIFCMDFQVERAKIPTFREQCVNWVLEFERYAFLFLLDIAIVTQLDV
ncbi:hypothetical protein VKT23_015098 [Stygiomarasmius scandens]|uniref:Uncharacterized protein n=1 Tax=Marasmiellus scandens TaxID=2682957 RepID=A0ABR1J364_9AGAR